MDDLLEDIATQKELIEQTLEALSSALARKERSFVERAASATCLHNVYNGIENLLKRVLKFLKISLPDSPSSHQDLVELAVEKNLISAEVAEALDDYRTFRHFFVHSYGILLSEAPLQSLSDNLPETWLRFYTEIEAYVGSLREPVGR